MLDELLKLVSVRCFFLNGSLDDIFDIKSRIGGQTRITYKRTFWDLQKVAALVVVDRILLGKNQPSSLRILTKVLTNSIQSSYRGGGDSSGRR